MQSFCSRLPSFSDRSESIGEDWKLGEYGREPLHERQQPVLGHGGDEFVKHAALPEQRVGAPFGGVGFEVPIIAECFACGAEQHQRVCEKPGVLLIRPG